MTYTFYHRGILVGESDLEAASGYPRQRGGIFWPTPYGLQLFPRLSGMLSAAHALKTHIEATGLCADDMESDDIEVLFETTPAGQKVMDIGRLLSDVEIRAPDGRPVEVAALAFSDLTEIQHLTRELRLDCADGIADAPADAPCYIVSATLCHETPAPARPAEHQRRRGRMSS